MMLGACSSRLDEQAAGDDAASAITAPGEVDAARDDDDRRADRGDAVDRRVLQHQERVRAVQERMVTRRRPATDTSRRTHLEHQDG